MMDYKLYKVVWVDSHGYVGWGYKDDLEVPNFDVQGVGYLVKETDECICLSSQIATDCFHATMCIPKVAIKSMTEITDER